VLRRTMMIPAAQTTSRAFAVPNSSHALDDGATAFTLAWHGHG
jgi:hypothetical protein